MRNDRVAPDFVGASSPGEHLSWYIIFSKLGAAFGGSVAVLLGG